MKTLIKILLLFLATVQYSSGQGYFYYYKDEKIPLQLSTEQIFIQFQEGLTDDEKIRIATSSPLFKSFEKSSLRHSLNKIVVGVIPGATSDQIYRAIKMLNKSEGVAIANPFFIYEKENTSNGISGKFYVKLKPSTNLTDLEKLASGTTTRIEGRYKFDADTYILTADKNSLGNALKMANLFFESGLFVFSQPSFLQLSESIESRENDRWANQKNAQSTIQCSSNDQRFSDQWALQNTGQYGGTPGADISVCGAWDITRGSTNIAIAILDDGVSLNPNTDLAANLLPGFDAVHYSTGGGPAPGDFHGTNCAGVAAAVGNNIKDISGVAPNCKIIPVRVAEDGTVDADNLAEGLEWAWQNGADILSASLIEHFPDPLIDIAIYNAVTNGRGGLGCPVLFAAGNSDANGIAYPAYLGAVIAVGATSMCDQRKSSSSCDGLTDWGSNYGVDLDVVAPGVKIVTTGNLNFGGTSSACPCAAGVMALILSVNRCMTLAEARWTLEASCDKVGNYCYAPAPGRQNGTWNEEMGYGRINAEKAVKYALMSDQSMSFNVGGIDQGASSPFPLNFTNAPCGPASANYFVKRHAVIATVNYPYTPNPYIVGTANGYSQANPSTGEYYLEVLNVSPTSATVRTFVYDAIAANGAQLWIPTSPSNVRFVFTALNDYETDIYLQNTTASTGTVIHNALNSIVAGRNVTNSLPIGDYKVESGANVTLRAGKVINLEPGTFITPDAGGMFIAYVEPFFTCTPFPNGRNAHNNYIPSAVVGEYKVERLGQNEDLSDADREIGLIIYPNPVSQSATIEFSIEKSELVELTLHDICGRPLLKLKNRSLHEAGAYQVRLSGLELAPGVYFCTLQTDSKFRTEQLVIVK